MSALDEMLSALRQLADKDAIETRVAAYAGPELHAAVTATMAAGATSEGKPWAERKAGGRAYANAASKLSYRVDGNLVRLILVGPEVYGHYGAGMAARPMLPDAGAGMPPSVEGALTRAAYKVWNEVMR